MSNESNVYLSLFKKRKPINDKQIAKLTGLSTAAVRTALHRLVNNPLVDIEVFKINHKTSATYKLNSNKPVGEIFKVTRHDILAKILHAADEPLSYAEISVISKGELSVSQVRCATDVLVKAGNPKINKIKIGSVLKIQMADVRLRDTSNIDSIPNANAIDLLMSGRIAEAVFKQDMMVNLRW